MKVIVCTYSAATSFAAYRYWSDYINNCAVFFLCSQILRLINPPVFEVERLLINKTNTQCAVIGSKGIVIVRIPRRWGIDGIFEGGKSEITCG